MVEVSPSHNPIPVPASVFEVQLGLRCCSNTYYIWIYYELPTLLGVVREGTRRHVSEYFDDGLQVIANILISLLHFSPRRG